MSTEALFWAVEQPVGNVYEKAVLWELANLANKNKNHTAWPSIATIARRVGGSDKPVRLAIKRLAARKLIEVLGGRGYRRYRLRLENDVAEEAPASGGSDNSSGRNDRSCGRSNRQSYYNPIKDPDFANAQKRPGGTQAAWPSSSAPQSAAPLPVDARWAARVKAFRQRGFWTDEWGPQPDAPAGWLVPPEVLRMFGYG